MNLTHNLASQNFYKFFEITDVSIRSDLRLRHAFSCPVRHLPAPGVSGQVVSLGEAK